MHLYIITRGVKNHVDQFITELQGKYLTWENEKEGDFGLKKGTHLVQVAVRPIQLWEIVYPEQHSDLVLNSILGKGEGKPQYTWQNKMVLMIRKILKIEAIPEYKQEHIFPVTKQHMEIVGIGVKKDRYQNGTEML